MPPIIGSKWDTHCLTETRISGFSNILSVYHSRLIVCSLSAADGMQLYCTRESITSKLKQLLCGWWEVPPWLSQRSAVDWQGCGEGTVLEKNEKHGATRAAATTITVMTMMSARRRPRGLGWNPQQLSV